MVVTRERAEELTDELMGDIYESTLSDAERGEFARVVTAVVGAQQSS